MIDFGSVPASNLRLCQRGFDTLAKIAGAMELPLSQFFMENGRENGSKGLPQLTEDEVRFLTQMRRYAAQLNDSDRKLVLAMVKKMAGAPAR